MSRYAACGAAGTMQQRNKHHAPKQRPRFGAATACVGHAPVSGTRHCAQAQACPCSTYHTTRSTQYARRSTQHAVRNTQYATRSTQHAVRNTQYAQHITNYAARNTQHDAHDAHDTTLRCMWGSKNNASYKTKRARYVHATGLPRHAQGTRTPASLLGYMDRVCPYTIL
jgi:hypothetical protein